MSYAKYTELTVGLYLFFNYSHWLNCKRIVVISPAMVLLYF